MSPSIAEALAGKRIAVTGSTGFVGTALVERLLRQVPGCELVLLVRPGRRSTAAQRVQREILRNDAFDRLRAELGKDGFEEMTARRVRTIAGDVGTDGLGLDDDDRATLASCDIVIHSAATVAFDSPLDGAVEVNLLGPTRIVTLLGELGVTPHLVAVSTCYVAGNRRGRAPEELVAEGPFAIGLDWKAEVAAARRLRSDAEAESRRPEMLARFRTEARNELGAAGAPALAAKTEQRRERWVTDRLVAGRPVARRQRRLARRLRLHEGARRAGAARVEGRRARSRSCGRRSSSRPSPSPARAGSAASAWPSRSSSPTPAGC